jgi:RimJ/RimL family protein N-acetyltransferase
VQIRTLEPHEFHLLDQVPSGMLSGTDPDRCFAVGALEGDKLIGCALLVVLPHIEGIWVDPEHRNGLTAAGLEKSLVRWSHEVLGIEKIFAYAFTDQIAGYLERIGYKRIPVTLYEKETV